MQIPKKLFNVRNLATQALQRAPSARYCVIKHGSRAEAITLHIGEALTVSAANVPDVFDEAQVASDLQTNPLIVNGELYQFDGYREEYMYLYSPLNETKSALVRVYEEYRVLLVLCFAEEKHMLLEMDKVT